MAVHSQLRAMGRLLAAVAGQQLQNKVALTNSLPPFPNELKGAGVTSVPNMVSYCQRNTTLQHIHTKCINA